MFSAVNKTNVDFINGFKAGISIAIGYAPAALAFGLLAKSTGLTFDQALGLSIFVYAGAAQYMALNLIALGIGSLEIIFTTFVVNIRHLLMSAALHEKTENDALFKKIIYSFGLTDEVFAVASTREGKLSSNYMFGLVLIAYASWVVHTGIGYALGSILPSFLQTGMTIALYAMFIGLLIPSIKKQKAALYLAISAAILNSIFSVFIPSGWAIVLATLGAVFLWEMVSSKKERTQDRE